MNNSNNSSNYSEFPAERTVRRARSREDQRTLLQKNLSQISIAILVIVFALICIFLLVFPRSKVSYIEKRELAAFPKFSFKNYFSGEYTAGIMTFYDDTVPYHDEFKNMSNQLKTVFGAKMFASAANTGASAKPDSSGKPGTVKPSPMPEENLLEGVAGRYMPTELLNAASAKDEPYQRDYTAEENGTLEWVNGLIVVNWDGHWQCMEAFGGGGGSTYAEALNTLQSKVGSDVTIWSMPAPTASAFYAPKNALEYVADQAECFDGVASKLNAGIKSVNVVDAMKKHTEEGLYCRTDHHWRPIGAYYAARTFAEAAKVPFADLSTYEKQTIPGFVGTMYGYSSDTRILNDPDDFEYYVPSAEYKAYYYDQSFDYVYTDDLFAEVDDASNAYLTMLGGDGHALKIDTEVDNGRKLLVIKDSFGNAEIPYYTSSFEQIFVVDVREFRRNIVDFIDTMGVTDVLFTMSAFSVVGDNANEINELITQDAGNPIVDNAPGAVPPDTTDGTADDTTTDDMTDDTTNDDSVDVADDPANPGA